MNTVEGKKQEKRRALLDAAYELFLERGASKTSVEDITSRAKVGKGTFYLYFADKDDLLQQLLYQISYDIIRQAYIYAEQRRTDDFAENIIIFADWIIDYLTEHTDILRLIERNFSWPMIQRSLTGHTDDPLWRAIVMRLHDTPLADIHNSQELYDVIFIIVEMCGTVCYSSIIEGRPDTIDNMKPLLYRMIRRLLR